MIPSSSSLGTSRRILLAASTLGEPLNSSTCDPSVRTASGEVGMPERQAVRLVIFTRQLLSSVYPATTLVFKFLLLFFDLVSKRLYSIVTSDGLSHEIDLRAQFKMGFIG